MPQSHAKPVDVFHDHNGPKFIFGCNPLKTKRTVRTPSLPRLKRALPSGRMNCGDSTIDGLLAGDASVKPLTPGAAAPAVGHLQDLLRGHCYGYLPDPRAASYNTFGSATARAIADYRGQKWLEPRRQADSPHCFAISSPAPLPGLASARPTSRWSSMCPSPRFSDLYGSRRCSKPAAFSKPSTSTQTSAASPSASCSGRRSPASSTDSFRRALQPSPPNGRESWVETVFSITRQNRTAVSMLADPPSIPLSN